MSKMREARNKMGYSQDELARLCECSRVTIANVERGKNKPSLDLADKIAFYLDTNIYEIFFLSSFSGYLDSIYDAKNEAIDKIFERVKEGVVLVNS